jgi:hypothetical protein
MVLRLRGQECHLPVDLCDRPVWQRGALETLARAQYRPAALVELFRALVELFRKSLRAALRLPGRGRSPGPTWLKHLMVLRLPGQECHLPADLFDQPVWKRGALETLARAQYRPAALVELFRKSFQAALRLTTR